MKHTFTCLFGMVFAVLILSIVHCSSPNERVLNSPHSTLYESCKPYTRWWWFAAEIDTADVKYQLDWLKENGFGGVEIAWIYPMHGDSTVKRPQWLSPEWSSAVTFAKRYADRIGLGCDYTYGSLWPFCSPTLNEEDGHRGYFDDESQCTQRLTWEHPRLWRILNHLDKEAFGRYADEMNKGLKEAYKGSASGLFVDSWEVETRYMWTKGFGDTFRERMGYDIEPYMDKLYSSGNERVYYDYMKVLSDYVLYQFYAPFTENAHRNGAFSRAQCGGAPTDLLTAFGLVDIPETEAILYEPNFGRIAASASALENKAAVSAEAFTCMYGWVGWSKGPGPYQGQEQIADMRLIADALFANGTNQIIWHGTPYNKQGDRSNYFYASVQNEPGGFFSGQVKEFNEYMTLVSSYMRRGNSYSDVAVYMPLEDSWMGVEYPDSLQMPWVWGEYELRYIHTPSELKGRQPLWINHHYLVSSEIKNGVLKSGHCSFNALVVDVEFMDGEALKNIVRLAEQGLPIWLKRDPLQPGKKQIKEYDQLLVKLKGMPNVSQHLSIIPGKALIEGDDLPDWWCREDDSTYYIFIANPSAQALTYPLRYNQAFEDSGSKREIRINVGNISHTLQLNFKPNESLLIEVEKQSGKYQLVDLAFSAKKISNSGQK